MHIKFIFHVVFILISGSALLAQSEQGKQNISSFRHPDGYFKFDLPTGWRITSQGPGTVLLTPGFDGSSAVVMYNRLEPNEIGQSVGNITRNSLSDIDDLLFDQFGIQANSLGTKIETMRLATGEGAWAQWQGMVQTDQGQTAIAIWQGVTLKQDFYLMLLAIVVSDQEDRVIPDIRHLFSTVQLLNIPSADELERQSSGPADASRKDQPSEQPLSRNVTFNRVRIDDVTLQLLETGMSIQIPDGDFWYDGRCGAIGQWGGPAIAFFPAHLNLGGPLSIDASGGSTQVIINGRALHPMDVAGLQSIIGAVIPGRYWLDAQGNLGYEGGPALMNLVQAAQTAPGGGGGGGSQAWTRYKNYGGAIGSTNMGSFGGGDYYFSGGGVDWWPGK